MPKKKQSAASQQAMAAKGTKTKINKERRVKQGKYKSFHYSKRLRPAKPPLTGAFRLFITSVRYLIKKWRLFGGIVLVYLVLTATLVKNFSFSSGLGETAQELFDVGIAEFATSLTLFGLLVGSPGNVDNEAAGAYQTILMVISSLAIIWALRTTSATKKVKVSIRDAFYKGMYPFVPFILVLLVIGLQLIPLLAANFLYAAVFGRGLAVTPIETGLWITLMVLMAVLSLYMITSSLFALYIVTLPDVTPMQALRSARGLVRYRRMAIMRKLLFLPLTLLLLAALIIVPIITVSPDVAEFLFFVLTMAAPAVGHSYIYHLYRELL